MWTRFTLWRGINGGRIYRSRLERLNHLSDADPVRIGLSATQRPIEEMARFLVGSPNVDALGNPQCDIVDEGA